MAYVKTCWYIKLLQVAYSAKFVSILSVHVFILFIVCFLFCFLKSFVHIKETFSFP